MIKKEIQCFISGRELELAVNRDKFTLSDKIRSAIKKSNSEPIEFITLQKYEFNKEKIGYNVNAIIMY